MRSTEIRSTFTDFFTDRDHRVVPSSPLIPADPTVLLTNAGMNQFKPYYLGESVPGHRRATSVQKCARTSDIDNVGVTCRHATFFEMLGNFSFGDYFKAETIAWSWELLTEHFDLDPARLWITVYTQELAGRPYPGRDGSEASTSFRVVTEHSRTIAFLIADGILPGRDGRGYVLRRLMRRTVRHARLLGIDGPVLPTLTGTVIDTLGTVWPELERHRSLIEQVVTAEEAGFDRTLRQGSRLLETAIDRSRSAHSTRLPGQVAFELHDTFGFPIDLTVDAARSAGLTVDEDAFAALLDRQQRQAAQAGRAKKGTAVARQDTYRRIAAEHGLTDFAGYGATTTETRLVALLKGDRSVPAAAEGDEVEVVLDRSPFYAEAGGQVGDTGTLRTGGGAVLRIHDTRPGVAGLHVHSARVVSGEVRTGEPAEAIVDADRRAAIARSHTATHVLHAMLRRVLGDHAAQRGSRVEPGRLRFDFAHFSAVDADRLTTIQTMVNDHLLDDPDVEVWEATRGEAEAAGATALFGEKYGDRVRIVDIGDFSRELCGGTHVGHGSQAGPVHILAESSIGASLRRIEALTGADVLRHYDHEHAILAELAGLLGVRPADAADRLRHRLDALTATQHQLERLRKTELASMADLLNDRVEPVEGGWLVAERLDAATAEELRSLATDLARRPGLGAAILGTGGSSVTGGTSSDGSGSISEGSGSGSGSGSGKAMMVAAITADLAATGLRASDLLTDAARLLGGGAGGDGSVASAGGRLHRHLGEALSVARTQARDRLVDRSRS